MYTYYVIYVGIWYRLPQLLKLQFTDFDPQYFLHRTPLIYIANNFSIMILHNIYLLLALLSNIWLDFIVQHPN